MHSFFGSRASLYLSVIVACLCLLSGCGSQEQREDVVNAIYPQPVSDTVAGVWHIRTNPETLSEVISHGKGLLLPVLSVTDQNVLVPDYRTSLALYDRLQKNAGMNLASAGNTMKFYYQLVSAMEHGCPQDAVDPLLSCSLSSWLPKWMTRWYGSADIHDEAMLQAWMDDLKTVSYLVVPDCELLSSNALRQLKYSPDSEPVVDMRSDERWGDLFDNLGQVSLTIVVRYQGNCESDWCWSKPGLASCVIPLQLVQGRDPLVAAREQAWSEMLSACASIAPTASVRERSLTR